MTNGANYRETYFDFDKKDSSNDKQPLQMEQTVPEFLFDRVNQAKIIW